MLVRAHSTTPSPQQLPDNFDFRLGIRVNATFHDDSVVYPMREDGIHGYLRR